ncbi:MAG TPA: hypothetical protein PLY56_08375 [Armatimonadota bacterium]|jgi:hypothetical protein|nr:hypothetical protein [Armatimonadota bacterium]HOJ21537.1 hypothetical protein [Armatimonadota bacterium]HOM82133.1 hypothetical protein [Armatimonadota bacterium]
MRDENESAARDQPGKDEENALKQLLEGRPGFEQRVGDYTIAVATGGARGAWVWHAGALHWRKPSTGENQHVDVVVRDAADGRFIPGLSVYVTLSTPGGQELGTKVQPFLWHPFLYHYGANWCIPEEGDYNVTVRVEPATFPRHGKEMGERYTLEAVALFTGLHMSPAVEEE